MESKWNLHGGNMEREVLVGKIIRVMGKANMETLMRVYVILVKLIEKQ